MLGRLIGRLLGSKVFQEKLPAPGASQLADAGDIFAPRRAAIMEDFARTRLGYTGDFKTLRSVVDLAACAGKLEELNVEIKLSPRDFVRRHSANGHGVPEEYYSEGLEQVRAFLSAQNTPLASSEVLASFLPDGQNLAQAAHRAGQLDELLAPAQWARDVTDYTYVLEQLWPSPGGAAAVLREQVKQARDAKRDKLNPMFWRGEVGRLDPDEQVLAYYHRGNLEKAATHSPLDWFGGCEVLEAALRYGVAPPAPRDGFERSHLTYLFGDDENEKPILTRFAAQPELADYLVAVAGDDSGKFLSAIFKYARPEHLAHPATCQLFGRILKATLGNSASAGLGLEHLKKSPLDEPWLLTAERLGWGDVLRPALGGQETLIDPEDLQSKGYDGKSYLELLGGTAEAGFVSNVAAVYSKLSGLVKPTLLLTEHLRHKAATRGLASEQLSLAQAFSAGMIGDCIRQNRTRELCGILSNRGYLPDSALLHKKITYTSKAARDEPATLLQAILAADSNWSFTERMTLVGPAALREGLLAASERELQLRPDLVRTAGETLTLPEALELQTRDQKPLFPILARAKALAPQALDDLRAQPARMFGALGKSSPYQALCDSYPPAQLLDVSALAAQPQYFVAALRQTADISQIAEPVARVFEQLAQDIAHGQRPPATVGFTVQDWLMEQPDGNEPLLVRTARAGQFSAARRVLALLPDAPSAGVLARTGSGKSALTSVLKERGELGLLASASEWGDDFDGYLSFRQKLEGKKLDAEQARFQFYAARLKARHRTPALD